MARLVFPSQPKSALDGSRHCLVLARQGRIESGLNLFPEDLSRLLSDLADEIKSGYTGGLSSTLAPEFIHRLSLGIIAGAGSRYSCPARPDIISQILSASDLYREPRSTIVICIDHLSHLEATLTGIARGLPLYTRKSSPNNEPRIQIIIVGPNGQPVKVPQEERNRVSAIRKAAALVDTPPSELHPEHFAAQAKRSIEDIPRVTIKELSGPALNRQGLHGLFAVGKGASKPPRLFCATYRPVRPKGSHIALVGKGITFDTGGLHIKARGSMEGMKCDMAGAAAALGAFQVLAQNGAPMQLSLLLCLAENAIGPAAYKPDDIITMHSGKTVEINNTDAEGRLVLADGLSYAARCLGAKILIDTATLTGAQMIATGDQHAAVVSNDPDLESVLVKAGQTSGDLVHPLPFAPEFYQSEFRSTVADMRNSVKNRNNAQSSCAAQFLWSHIDSADVKWAHIDLAGPAWQGDRGTGFGVALLVRSVRELSPPSRSPPRKTESQTSEASTV